MTGDAKGEYRGLAYRDETALKAWLAKRPREAALEPALPIIDPHHHFWDTPQRGRYLLPELLEDLGGSQRSEASPDAVSASSAGARGGHNIVSTVFLECRSMYKKDGPAEMAPVGEVEFVNGIAAMSASGGYGPCRPDPRGARARSIGGRDPGRRRALSWHPPRRVMGRQRRDPEIRDAPDP